MENEAVLHTCPVCGDPSVIAPAGIEPWQIVAACPYRERIMVSLHALVKYMGEKDQRLTEENRRLRAAVEYLTPLMGRQTTAIETVQMIAAEFRRMRQHLEGISAPEPATPEDLEQEMNRGE